MRKQLLTITLILMATGLIGCGTTLQESMGEPPALEQKQTTGAPVISRITHAKEAGNTVVIGLNGCVEPGALVVISTVDNTAPKVLSEATANSYGGFQVVFNDPVTLVAVQALAPNKEVSFTSVYNMEFIF